MKKKNQDFLAYGAGILAVIIWGLAPSLIKMALQHMDETFLLFGRFVFSSAILVPAVPGILKKYRQVPRFQWLQFIAVVFLNFYLQTLALKGLSASLYIVVFSLNPILSLIILDRSVKSRTKVSVFICLLGTLIFIDPISRGKMGSLFSFLCLIGGMLTWVAFTVSTSRLQKVFSDLEITTITNYSGLVTMAAIWILAGHPHGNFDSSEIWTESILGLSLPLAFFLYSYSIRKKRTFGIISQYLEPVVGVFCAAILLGEKLSVFQLSGGAAIIFGLAYSVGYKQS